ncbi:MAG TPA: type VI secretion system tube protein Hcp [Fimbriiglobus sp.]|jgi:type VI secretion system secreted protein Hcp
MPIYMKYDGINGSVTKCHYEKWIELESCQFGAYRNITSATGQPANREANAPSISEIVVTKFLDTSSTGLQREALTGDGKKVTIAFVQSNGADFEYLKIELENTLISSYNISGHGGVSHDRPMESLSLNFTKITYTKGTESTARSACKP